MYAWGPGNDGQLGNNSTADSSVPVAVVGLGSGVTAIAAGYRHSLAVCGGAVYAWGNNADAELGNRSTTNSPVPIATAVLTSGVTAVAAGRGHCLALRDGTVYSWGRNDYGQLGDGSSETGVSATAISGLTSGVTSIAAGDFFSLAVRDGHVFAWGSGDYGQLGNGTTNSSSTPTQVDPADLTNIVAVAANEGSCYALAADGSLWVWGLNLGGVLGLGTNGDSGTNGAQYTTPQHLLPPAGYVYSALSSGSSAIHVLAILTPGPPSTFFLGEAPLKDGVYYLAFSTGNYFGYYAFLSNPNYIYHFDMGYEEAFAADDGKAVGYRYECKSTGFFYTAPSFPFPYLYDFTLKTVLYYYPDPNNPGHYNTDGTRYFYDFSTGQTITK